MRRRTGGGESALLSLVGTIYEAAAEPERWPACLARLADHLHSAGASNAIFDVAGRRLVCAWEHGLDHLLEASLTVPLENPWAERSMRAPVGLVQRTEELVSLARLRRSEFYRQFLRPRGVEHGLGCVLLREGPLNAACSLYRGRRDGPYTEEQVARLRCLVPHLQRANQLVVRMQELLSGHRAAIEVLDRLPLAVFLLDNEGLIGFANRAAEALLRRQDGVLAREGALEAHAPAESRRLRALVAAAAKTGNGHGLAAGGALSLSRPSGKSPLQVLVSPFRMLDAGLLPGTRRPAAIVFAGDPDADARDSSGLLAALYGLTPAESRVALAIANGLGPAEAAAALGVSLATVRTQLKQVYQKTETRRQSELVRLLFAGVLRLGEPG